MKTAAMATALRRAARLTLRAPGGRRRCLSGATAAAAAAVAAAGRGTDAVEVYDVAVVGGGIVGLATAREILGRYPQKRVVVLEKEAEVSLHQSG